MQVIPLRSKTVISLAGFGLAAGLVAGAGTIADAHHDHGHGHGHHHGRVTEKQIPNLGIVKNQIKAYYGDEGSHEVSPTSDYAAEITSIERRTARSVKWLIHRADDNPVLLLDVDDTTLSTYNYEATHDFGYDPVVNNDYIQNHGMGPTTGMPRFTNYAARKGAEVYYLTGRSEMQRDATLRDLAAAGYPDVASDHLFMRNKDNPPAYLPCEPDCTTVQYKTGTRKHIESLGNDIVLNLGDQYSDLEGGYADRTVKVPNPMYYLP